MSYEKIIIAGNVGKAEVLHSGAGNPYFRMSVAVNRKSGDQKETIWYSVLMYGKLGENVEGLKARYTVGRRVLVEGRPQADAFIRKDGSAGLERTIIAQAYPELLDAP